MKRLFVLISFLIIARNIIAQSSLEIPRVVLFNSSIITDSAVQEIRTEQHTFKWIRERNDSSTYYLFINGPGFSSIIYSGNYYSSTMTTFSDSSVHVEEYYKTGNLKLIIDLQGYHWSEYAFEENGQILYSFICDYSTCDQCREELFHNEIRELINCAPLGCVDNIDYNRLNDSSSKRRAVRLSCDTYFDSVKVRQEILPLEVNYR
jgi:hypothetical protein